MSNHLPRFASALSTQPQTSEAIVEVCRESLAQLGAAPDLALVFFSHHHGPEFSDLAAGLCEALGTDRLVGCSGESIVGGAREIEDSPALSLWLASLSGVELLPMHLHFQRTPEGGTIVGWPDTLPERWPDGATLMLLGEPFSFPTDLLLDRLQEDQPHVPVVGGMASGGHRPGMNRLFLGRNEYDSGAIGLLVHGNIRLRSVVSQGCRPIGRHFVVTRAERNVIRELSGKPALEQLRELFPSLSPREQKLVQQGLHVGRVINEFQGEFRRGDFLVRNLVGADPETGAIAIGDYIRVGQTVQFHVRDAQTADEDLRELLAAPTGDAEASPQAALLFTCNGRGTRLFEVADHDAEVIQETLGAIPTAGFFAQGEIGPIGGRNFVHGFTASVVLFEPAGTSSGK